MSIPGLYERGTENVPGWYSCAKCGAHGVKLWRQYQTLACYVRLLCAECAKKDQKKRFAVDEAGEHVDRYGHKSDQIGWLIPAVPTDDMDTYWGYTTVPEVGCVWWDMLPVVEMCEEESSIKPSTGQK